MNLSEQHKHLSVCLRVIAKKKEVLSFLLYNNAAICCLSLLIKFILSDGVDFSTG